MISFTLVFSKLYEDVFRKTEYIARTYAAKQQQTEGVESHTFDNIAATEDDTELIDGLFSEAHATLSNALKDYSVTSNCNEVASSFSIHTPENFNEGAVSQSVGEAARHFFVNYAVSAWLHEVGADGTDYAKQADGFLQQIKYALTSRKRPALKADAYSEPASDTEILDGGTAIGYGKRNKEDVIIDDHSKDMYSERTAETKITDDDVPIPYGKRSEEDIIIDDRSKDMYSERVNDTDMAGGGSGVIGYAKRNTDNIELEQLDGFYKKKSNLGNDNFNI